MAAPPRRLAVVSIAAGRGRLETAHAPGPGAAARGFAVSPPSRSRASGGWTEERAVVVGFVILAALAGLIIFVASFLDSLT